jgi:hypothetical protein
MIIDTIILCYTLFFDLIYVLSRNSSDPSGTGMLCFGLMLPFFPLSVYCVFILFGINQISLNVLFSGFMTVTCFHVSFSEYLLDRVFVIKSVSTFSVCLVHGYMVYTLMQAV